jgi:hypothetical protein
VGLPASLTTSNALALQRAVGNAVVSSLVADAPAAIQRKFQWGHTMIDSEDALIKSGIDREKIGSSKTPRSGPKRKKDLDERWGVLVEMAKSDEVEGAAYGKDLYGQLKELIGKFRGKMRAMSSLTAPAPSPSSSSSSSSSTSSTSSSTSSTSGGSKATRAAERAKTLGDKLKQLGNVITEEKINSLVKQASALTGYGWYHEMLVAYDLAEAEPSAVVQVGVLPKYEIDAALQAKFGTDYQAAPTTTEPKGKIGGDVTVWRKTATQKRTTFIQAKTAVSTSLRANVLEAANQLASLTASGDEEGKAWEREFTFTGNSYEGAIAVQYTPPIQFQVLKDAASEVFDDAKVGKFVDRVVYEEYPVTAGDAYTEFTRQNRDGKSSPVSPLTNSQSIGTA